MENAAFNTGSLTRDAILARFAKEKIPADKLAVYADEQWSTVFVYADIEDFVGGTPGKVGFAFKPGDYTWFSYGQGDTVSSGFGSTSSSSPTTHTASDVDTSLIKKNTLPSGTRMSVERFSVMFGPALLWFGSSLPAGHSLTAGGVLESYAKGTLINRQIPVVHDPRGIVGPLELGLNGTNQHVAVYEALRGSAVVEVQYGQGLKKSFQLGHLGRIPTVESQQQYAAYGVGSTGLHYPEGFLWGCDNDVEGEFGMKIRIQRPTVLASPLPRLWAATADATPIGAVFPITMYVGGYTVKTIDDRNMR